jgi:hypothetical protein
MRYADGGDVPPDPIFEVDGRPPAEEPGGLRVIAEEVADLAGPGRVAASVVSSASNRR